MDKKDKLLKDLLTGKISWWFTEPSELMELAINNLRMDKGIKMVEDVFRLLHDIPIYVKMGKIKIDDALFEIIPPRLKDFILKLNNM